MKSCWLQITHNLVPFGMSLYASFSGICRAVDQVKAQLQAAHDAERDNLLKELDSANSQYSEALQKARQGTQNTIATLRYSLCVH